MSYRETTLNIGEIYHVYNRGVEKRIIFKEKKDYERFTSSLIVFNTEDSTGGLFEFERQKLEKPPQDKKLVNIIAYSLGKNHYHFILEQIKENGIAKFMHKVGMGYSKYFNHKYQRVGTLFQGNFKSIHVSTDEYLFYLSVYINLNNKIHTGKTEDLEYSSWGEYSDNTITDGECLCSNELLLNECKNKNSYKKNALRLLPELIRQKMEKKELKEKEIKFQQITLET